jgi:hypothetical protein
MIAMDVEFLSGKFRIEWNEGRFVVIADKLVLEPEEMLDLGELIQSFCDSKVEEDGNCCDEAP